MNNKKYKFLSKIILAISVCLISIVFFLSGVLKSFSDQVNDLVYQKGDIPLGVISLIQIDENALAELGPYNTWTRDYVAEAIRMLNENPEKAPAAIGVDIMYIGYSNEESDANLVEASALSDNVVFGSFINTDTVLTENDGIYSMENAVTLYEEPFEELQEVSTVGFVNGMSDADGVVRHGVKEFELADGRIIPSFSYAVYQKYAEKVGMPEVVDVPVNDNGYYYIDFTGEPGAFSNSFSLSDFIEGEIPIEYFSGGIVLIGSYAEAMMDSFRTPVDKSQSMYGMEVHANMLENYLTDNFKREASKGVVAVIIGIVSICAVVFCYMKKMRESILFTIVILITYPLICMGLYEKGYVLDVIYVPVCVAVIMIINIARKYILEVREKRKVEKTFKRYVAPEIVDELTKTGMENIKLGGEAVDCAILFVDIRGFTTMSESLDPEQVVSILNSYLELTSESIFKYDGTLDKFIGDATMAIFGAPIPQEDYIYKAVMAAWNMVEKSYEMAEKLEKEFGRSVSFGIGVHCGKAVVGNIGTARRMDYTAIGDTVNTAARLEANAPSNTVYISKNVRDALGDRISAESIGNLPLKGKSEELEVFKLTGIR